MEIMHQIIRTYSQKFFKPFLCKITSMKENTSISIPIQPHTENKCSLPVHISRTKPKMNKLTQPVITALGGMPNIETYLEIPNSRRIRLTLVNPSLIDTVMLEKIDVRMFVRIGKRIIHIIP